MISEVCYGCRLASNPNGEPDPLKKALEKKFNWLSTGDPPPGRKIRV